MAYISTYYRRARAMFAAIENEDSGLPALVAAVEEVNPEGRVAHISSFPLRVEVPSVQRRCDRCGRTYAMWLTSTRLWRLAVSEEADECGAELCLGCFRALYTHRIIISPTPDQLFACRAYAAAVRRKRNRRRMSK